jgi:hypothetical protein
MPPGATLLLWLPAAMACVLSAVALVSVAVSATPAVRRSGFICVAAVGAASLAVAVWQASASAERIAELIRRDRTTELAAEVKSLQAEIATLKESTRFRALGPDLASRLVAYLRPLGPRKVVVSCAANDIEAYRYTTEIASAIKDAGWDARGPEPTAIFGDVRGMGVNVYDSGGSDTAKVLIAAMKQFAISYQVRVPPSGEMPADAVELYTGSKPGPPPVSASGAAARQTAAGANISGLCTVSPVAAAP